MGSWLCWSLAMLRWRSDSQTVINSLDYQQPEEQGQTKERMNLENKETTNLWLNCWLWRPCVMQRFPYTD